MIKSVCDEELAVRVFVLTLCRAVSPRSEHGLSYFLKEYYVVNNKGKRWEPEFRDDFVERLHRSNGKNRVRVDWKKLARWYRALDKLIENKEKIEKEIYKNMKDLFSLKVNIVFYDITSTYFEGNGPKDIAKFGYSRDDKSDNKQILLGIVMANGLPLAHHVFAGNIADKTTVEFIISDLKRRFELNNIIFVSDKGMMTDNNVKRLDEMGYKYILGVSLRNFNKSKEILDIASRLNWKEYNKGE